MPAQSPRTEADNVHLQPFSINFQRGSGFEATDVVNGNPHYLNTFPAKLNLQSYTSQRYRESTRIVTATHMYSHSLPVVPKDSASPSLTMFLFVAPTLATPLLKVPLLLTAAVCTYYGWTPPMPKPDPKEMQRFAVVVPD